MAKREQQLAEEEASGETTLSSYHHEAFKRRTRYLVVFIGLIAAFFAMAVINIRSGDMNVSGSEIWSILIGKVTSGSTYDVIHKIRLPRILMAAILGGALSVSGFLLQTFFDNPIAGPFVLGISDGARMVVAIVMVLFISAVGSAPSWALVMAAFAGSLLATGFILLISRRVHNMAILLVAGLMVGYICKAATDFILTFAADNDIVNLRNWTLGSFSGNSWENVVAAAVLVGVAMLFTILLSKPIGAYQLGESYAQSMGVNIKSFRVILILLSSILSGTVTAFAGPISFVGIAVPFLIKQALGTSKPLVVIPATFLGGTAFCMMCDLIARLAFAPTELNISTVTAVFGAPVVIFMMLMRRTGRY